MEIFQNILNGFSIAITPMSLVMCLVGCFVGTLIGVLPGIGKNDSTLSLINLRENLPLASDESSQR